MCIHHEQKMYFCIEEVGQSVFEGSIGFWNDVQEYNKKKRKDIELLKDQKRGLHWCEAGILLRVAKWIQKDNNTANIRGFVKCLRKNGVYATKRRISPTVWKEVGYRHKWCCAHCKEMLKPTFELDHIIELERGGSDTIENIQPLCTECHAKKTHGFKLKKIRLQQSRVRTSKYFKI